MAPDHGLLKPDIVFYLKLDPNQANLRSDYGSERYEKLEMQLKVSENFEKLFRQVDNCKVIDANLSAEDMVNAASFENIDLTAPLGRLW